MGEVVAIWIKRARLGLMDRVEEANLVEGRGVEGSADQGGWRQITIIDEAAWRAAEQELGKEVDPERRRANVMVRGVDLENSRGRRLLLGDCVIEIKGENPPCRRMGDMQQPLRPHGRAGVFGKIEKGGAIRVGDPAVFVGSGLSL